MKPLICLLVFSCFLNIGINSTTTKDPTFIEKFKVKQLSEGHGVKQPIIGDEVLIHYTGKYPITEATFDTTVLIGEPYKFVVGQTYDDHHIACFDEVVIKMKLGEKIQVLCPASLAYGEKGLTDVVLPNQDLIYIIRLLKFTPSGNPTKLSPKTDL